MTHKNIFVKTGLVALLLFMTAAAIISIFVPVAMTQSENMALKISSDTSEVYAGIPRDIKFTVWEYTNNSITYIPGASVHLSGAASGDATTDSNGEATITVNASQSGKINATASKNGYSSASTTITAKPQPKLNLTADTDIVYIGIPKNVTFTVNRECGTDPTDKCNGISLVPALGTYVYLTGAASGSGTTAYTNGEATTVITINATEKGTITAIANKTGFIDGSTTIEADYLPVAAITTERKNYSSGEVVVMTLSNTGPVNITPDILRVKNSSSSSIWWIYSSYSLGVDNLMPGQSVNLSWNQRDDSNNTVPSGLYLSQIVFSYNNRSYENITDPFQIINCLKDTIYPKPFDSTAGYTANFTINLTNTQKAWDMTWYINDTEVYNETDITNISLYSNNSAVVGVWNVTAVASHGCDLVSWTWVWTVSTAPSSGGGGGGGGTSGSGGGGGGGGGGIVSSEPYTNIVKSDRKDRDLAAGIPATYTFSLPDLVIYEVVVTGKENENGVGMRIEHLKETSALVNRIPPGVIYANENVWFGTKRYDLALVRFRVSNSWISSNNITNEDVALLLYDDGWKKLLNTGVINSDSNYTYFESRSYGLAEFAISGLKESKEVGQVNTTEDIPTVMTLENNTVVEENNSTEPPKGSPGFGAMLGVVAVTVVYILWNYSKKMRR